MERANVLLVDDEKDFNDALSKRLIHRGFSVRSVLSGREALVALEAGDMDVVILDMNLPDMDGLEALREIKSRHRHEVEVLLVTGHATLESGVSGMSLGAYDYLVKPLEFEELIGAIFLAHERKRLNS
ncbi:response regulator [Fundidesulfovibrio butyratiphilus]